MSGRLPLDTMSRFAHAARVQELLRQHDRDERLAMSRLGYSGPRSIDVAPVACPLTTHAPSSQNPDGARGELMFDGAESTH